MSVRAPALHRVAGALSWAGTVVAIGIILFVVLAVYSASQLRPDFGQSSGLAAVLDPNGTAELTTHLNLSNPGFFAVSPVTLAIELRFANGTLVGIGGAPVSSVAAGASAQIPVHFWVPLAGATILVTHDATLPMRIWANITYASVFRVDIAGDTNYSWGAPFANLNATPGTPSPQSNGTVLVPVQLSFENHASFPDAGVFTVTVQSSSGTACGTSTLSITTASHSSYNQGLAFYVSPSCASGGTVTVSYSGSGLTYSLPPQRLP